MLAEPISRHDWDSAISRAVRSAMSDPRCAASSFDLSFNMDNSDCLECTARFDRPDRRSGAVCRVMLRWRELSHLDVAVCLKSSADLNWKDGVATGRDLVEASYIAKALERDLSRWLAVREVMEL